MGRSSRSSYNRKKLHEQVLFLEDKKAMLERYRLKLLQRKVQKAFDEVGSA